MSDKTEQIDQLILSATTSEWVKTAVLISKVFDAPGFPGGTTAQDIAERIYVLIDNGQVEGKGNMRRWRDSEVKIK